ncbi:MAG: hypothetical protein JNL87_18295 [Burkholderiaceae bacterium]|nr:hypothetical protein [Burkholderiaceae bacterium]
MFPSTLPMDVPDSRPSMARPGRTLPARAAGHGFGRPAPAAGGRDSRPTTLSSLSPSLMQDLLRFDQDPPQRQLLEVLAACIRHTQPLAISLAWELQSLALTVFPLERLVHCPMPMVEFLAGDLAALQVLQVRPAALRPPGSTELARIGNPALYTALDPLLWAVALRGSRNALLPELSGQAAYRVAPGLTLRGLDLPGPLAACVSRLRRQTSNLREIAGWQQIGVARAIRLLNALYLQAGLIVSRTHPAATNEGWTGYDT